MNKITILFFLIGLLCNAQIEDEKRIKNIYIMLKQKKRSNRHRMNDFTARKLGLTPNKSMRYELNKEQKKSYSDLNMEKPIRRQCSDFRSNR